MYKERELLQRLLDGELADGERERVLKAIDADPVLRRDYEDFAETILAIEEAEHPPVPPHFTAEVMRRLPAPRAPLWRKAASFLFLQRTLRWNIATLAILLAVALSAAFFLAGRGEMGNTALKRGDTGTVMVRFQLNAPSARSVALTGEFNKWMVNQIMLQRGADGVWSVDVPLPPGAYTYMFVVDGGEWLPDPDADAYRDDGFGSRNSVRRVYHF